jgi:hypothetical protein
LLVLLLVSVFAPAALAIGVPAPHACCLRMKHDCTDVAHGHDPQFQAPPTCCNRDCSRPLTISQWGENPHPGSVFITPPSSTLAPASRSLRRSDDRSIPHAGRAPPQFSEKPYAG